MRCFTGIVMEWPPAGGGSTSQQDVHAVNLGATCIVFELENQFISKLWESLKSRLHHQKVCVVGGTANWFEPQFTAHLNLTRSSHATSASVLMGTPEERRKGCWSLGT
jgi:hypothetical protein